jgi:hypothetical protein
MGGPIVRTGTTPEFWQNWDLAFGKKGGAKTTKAVVKKAAKAAKPKAAKAARPKAARKKTGKK